MFSDFGSCEGLLTSKKGGCGLLFFMHMYTPVGFLAFLLVLENDETMAVRRLHHPHRGCPVAEVAAGHSKEALNRSDWNGDLAYCDNHSGHSDLALAKQRAIGWLGLRAGRHS